MAEQSYAYQNTSTYDLMRYDDRAEAERTLRTTRAAMRGKKHDVFYHRVTLACMIRARIASRIGHKGDRVLSMHEVV